MLKAELDSVALSIKLLNENYIDCLQKIELKAGVIIEPIYQKPDAITPDGAAKMRRIGKKINKRALFVGIAHTQRGLMYPISYYRNGRGIVIEFNGLTQYDKKEFVLTDKSELMRQDLKEFVSSGLDFELYTLDVCFDTPKPAKAILGAISCKREPKTYRGTTYYDAKAQTTRKNNYLRLYAYNKQAKDKLTYPLNRVEFSFKAAALKGSKTFDEAVNKAAGKIARWVDKKTVKISAFWSHSVKCV